MVDSLPIQSKIDAVYRTKSRRVFETLVRLSGNLEWFDSRMSGWAIFKRPFKGDKKMKVMVLIKASKDSEAGIIPNEQLLREMGAFNEELVKAGIMLAGEGLHPSSMAVRVRFPGDTRTVIDGPFTETRELLAGFWMWQVNSMEEAIHWVKKCPNPQPGEEHPEIEIRRVFSTEDCASNDPSGQLRAAEGKLRTETKARHLDAPRMERMAAKTILGINGSYTLETRSRIPRQWELFAPNLGKVPGQTGCESYGVSWNFKEGCGFDYLCGVHAHENTSIPPGWTTVQLPGQQYAVFTHKEHVSQIGETIDAIWHDWLPQSGHRPSHAPCFERYDENFNPKTGLGGTEIWIPVEG